MADDAGCPVREVDFDALGTLRIKEFTMLQDEAGAVVWDAGLVLSYYLAHQHSKGRLVVAGCTCVDLGSGTGLVGLTAARLGAHHVLLTDLPHLVPYMYDNIQLNGLDLVCSALPLEWGNEEHMQRLIFSSGSLSYPRQRTQKQSELGLSPLLRRTPRVVLAADVVYSAASRESLFRTLAALMSPVGDNRGVQPEGGAGATAAGGVGHGSSAPGASEAAGDAARCVGNGDERGSSTVAFLSYEQRPGVEEVLELCGRYSLEAEEIEQEELHPAWRSADLTILRLRTRHIGAC